MMSGSVTRDEIVSIDVDRLKALAYFRESGGDLRRRCKKNCSPEEYISYFRGNTRDLVVGVQYSNKTLKLCSDLKDSHLIVGTLRGLDALLNKGIDPRGGVPKLNTSKNTSRLLTIPDVFSSIEVLMLDRAELLEFQDTDLLTSVLGSVNGTVHEVLPNVDVRRVHPKFSSDNGDRFRQNIILSKGIPQSIARFFMSSCHNYRSNIIKDVLCFEEKEGVIGRYKALFPKKFRFITHEVELNAYSPIVKGEESEYSSSSSDSDESMNSEEEREGQALINEEEALFEKEILKRYAFPLVENGQIILIVLRDVLTFYNLVPIIDTSRGDFGPLDYQCLHEDLENPKKTIKEVIGRLTTASINTLIVTERFLLNYVPWFTRVEHVLFWGAPTIEFAATRLIEGVLNAKPKKDGTGGLLSFIVTVAFSHENDSNQRWLGTKEEVE